MNTLIDTAVAAHYEHGNVVIEMASGVEIRFPVAGSCIWVGPK